jgi:TPR repeat protein
LLFGRGTAKDEAAARPVLERACGASDAEACRLVGGFLERDPARAADYDRRACDGGNGTACDSLALHFEKGDGVPRDLPRAAELRTRGCKLGFRLGCGFLGWMYIEGTGVPMDEVKGVALMEVACTDGDLFDTGPCEWAADYFIQPEFAKYDPAKAKRLYKMACAGGRSSACDKLAAAKR